jgi:hypothetical protein
MFHAAKKLLGTPKPCPHISHEHLKIHGNRHEKKSYGIENCNNFYFSSPALSRHANKVAHPYCPSFCPVKSCGQIKMKRKREIEEYERKKQRTNEPTDEPQRTDEPTDEPIDAIASLDQLDDVLRTRKSYTCRHTKMEPFCELPKSSNHEKRVFWSKSNRNRHENRHASQCDDNCTACTKKKEAPKVREAKFAKLKKVMDVCSELGFSTHTELTEFLLSCHTTQDSANVITSILEKDVVLQRRVKQFLNLPEAIQKISIRTRYLREKERRDYLGKLNLMLNLGEEKQKILNSFLQLGFTQHQFRTWKEEKIEAFQVSKSDGECGYKVTLQRCVDSLLSGVDWVLYDQNNPEGILLTISTDGGGMDLRNGAIIVKIQRRDDEWTIRNRLKKAKP